MEMWPLNEIHTSIEIYIYIYVVGSLRGPHLGVCRVNQWSTFQGQ